MKIIGFTDDVQKLGRVLVEMSCDELGKLQGRPHLSSDQERALKAGQSFEVTEMFKEAAETIEAWKGLQASIRKTRDDSAKLLAKMKVDEPKAVG